MDMIYENARQTPVIVQTDVLVIGGGPAGLSAAIAAGRLGARTMIVERYGSLGGVLTQVGVESFAWYRHPGTEDCEGICREYESRRVRWVSHGQNRSPLAKLLIQKGLKLSPIK